MSRKPTRPKVPPAPSEIADRLHSAAIHLLRRLRTQDDKAGISAARLSALSVVVFGGPVTMGRLAGAERVSAPTMTRLVTAMERDGLITRVRDCEDGRVVWIRATGKGTRILHHARRRRVARLATDLSALSELDLKVVARAAEIVERLGTA